MEVARYFFVKDDGDKSDGVVFCVGHNIARITLIFTYRIRTHSARGCTSSEDDITSLVAVLATKPTESSGRCYRDVETELRALAP